MNYSEHEKMQAVSDSSRAIGEFLEWLDEQEIYLAKWSERDRRGFTELEFHLDTRAELLAKYFNINLKKIEEEKEQMMQNLRKMQKERT